MISWMKRRPSAALSPKLFWPRASGAVAFARMTPLKSPAQM
jgi:hypothetical protein